MSETSFFLRRRSQKDEKNRKEAAVVEKEEFKREKPQKSTERELVTTPLILPQEPLPVQPICSAPEIVIFGFSANNKNAILDLIDMSVVQGIQHGNNFVKLRIGNNHGLELLELNRKEINGEIIGVYRTHVVEEEIVKKRSLLQIIFEYLFGIVS